MIKKITTIILQVFFIFSITVSFAQDIVKDQDIIDPLFASDETLKFTLIIDTRELKKDESETPEYSDGQLILDQNGEDKKFDIKVRPRGNSRRFFDFCTFPPIKLNFKKKEVEGTIFEGQDKLKLVAYCKDLEVNEAYVLKEYLVYKLYNILTPNSFKVRLAEITYSDINNKGKEVKRHGFLIEDDDTMAERNRGKITEMLMSNHDCCERNTLDIFTIFQYMIGNTDWWIGKSTIHNVKLVFMDNGTVIPVPYDFENCGLVDAKYAIPPEELQITNVKQRLSRDYCRLPRTYEGVIDKYNEHKEAIYAEINNFDAIG